jgi:hypothetical protein
MTTSDITDRMLALINKADINGDQEGDREFRMGRADWLAVCESFGWQHKIDIDHRAVSVFGCSVFVDPHQNGVTLSTQPAYIKPPRKTYA